MKKTTGRILSALPAAAWAWVIWFFSDTPADVSTEESISVTEILLGLISRFVTIDPSKKALIVISLEPHIRKIAHMTEFGIFFLLLMIPLGLLIRKLSIRTGTAAFVSFLYACSDEIHQLFVEGRAGRVSDVLIDMMGVVIAALLYLIIAIPICLKKQKTTGNSQPRSET